ncbi:MAG TPA: tetratricopeptide repeat protein [Terriglobales bacterium]|nr:tetratricopeptide repeat protein [Terriglobales bacterium]
MSPAGSDQTRRASRPVKVTDDPRFAQAVQNYEAGLKALQAHKYDRAKACFEKVMAGPSRELADRASVHWNTCNLQLNRAATTFKTAEEQFDFAVSLMNMGDYVSARENFDQLAKSSPNLDFIWYGMAALNCLTGRFPEAIRNLGEAIRLNPANRFQARNDSDFKNLADDPRFTELLYPDTSTDAPPEAEKWR